MCNRYIPSFVDLIRVRKMFAAMPKFEEFTDRPKASPFRTSGTVTSSRETNPLIRDALDAEREARPTDRNQVIRVIDGEIRIDLLKWGLVPPHDPLPEVSYTTFNAKSETIATTRAYSHAWRAGQRCLVPIRAIIEWKGAKSPKQKYRISLKGQSEFFLAGLWEKWERGTTVLESFTIITTVANELVAEIHDKKRMPVIIATENCDRWLRDASDVSDLLKPYPAELMEAVPVGGLKSSKQDDGPFLFS